MSSTILGGFAVKDLDFDALSTLHSSCFSEPWDSNSLKNLCASEQNITFVSLNENKVIEALLILQCSGEDADILTFCVHPDKQKQGIGKNLLNTAFELLKSYGTIQIFLEVSDVNKNAYRTYINAGFTVVGVRKKYYNNQFDALTMKKELA
ncbi:MAG: ribosomal protein S18-alanine N-acetyltransferase [Alphaproteobacteria bacterium]